MKRLHEEVNRVLKLADDKALDGEGDDAKALYLASSVAYGEAQNAQRILRDLIHRTAERSQKRAKRRKEVASSFIQGLEVGITAAFLAADLTLLGDFPGLKDEVPTLDLTAAFENFLNLARSVTSEEHARAMLKPFEPHLRESEAEGPTTIDKLIEKAAESLGTFDEFVDSRIMPNDHVLRAILMPTDPRFRLVSVPRLAMELSAFLKPPVGTLLPWKQDYMGAGRAAEHRTFYCMTRVAATIDADGALGLVNRLPKEYVEVILARAMVGKEEGKS